MHMLCLKEEFEIDGFQRKMLKSWQKATQRQTQSSFLPIVDAVLISLTVFVLCVATQAGDRVLRIFKVTCPWDWKECIVNIGFTWLIAYICFHLLRFSAMDDNTLERLAKSKENSRERKAKNEIKP
ncbi:uncharacterized protein LOC114977811 [Acropora millepora]|uniref:uncharacterized protein LOC114977811 n=1 Tax=Acropora millepora TaxID=45264 RepID=UPI001CF2E35B|nr:uncharacterized protein LOC114977811 [Acropora millepora]